MFVSIVVTAHNAERWIGKTLDSVLRQSHHDFELVVVDDGSTDGTLEILETHAARDPRVIVISHENWGMARSANHAIEQARGNWVLRTDADDPMLPHRVERQIAFVQANPDVVAASCFIYYIDENENVIGRYSSHLTSRQAFDRLYASARPIHAPHQGAMIRRGVFLDVGGYRSEYWSADDTDLWNRLAEHGYVLIQPEYLQLYRIHGSSVSNTSLHRQLAKHRWVRDSLRRRRAGRPELPWDEFVATEESAPPLWRWNLRRSVAGHILYKKAVLAYSQRRVLRTAWWLIGAFVLAPIYTASQVTNKFVRHRVSRQGETLKARADSLNVDHSS